MSNDPYTKGRKLFETNCAVCHKFTAKDGDPFKGFTEGKFKAADLGDYASEQWIRGLLDNPGHDKYFGLTNLKGMINWRKRLETRERKRMDRKEIVAQEADFDLIAKFLADQSKPKRGRDPELARKGLEAFKAQECISCHNINNEGGGEDGPDLTNYGSQEWIRFMLMSPGHKLRFGDANEMPAFRNLEGPGSEVALREFLDANPDFPRDKILPLSDIEREMIIRFMTRDDRAVFGGQPIAGAPKGDRVTR